MMAQAFQGNELARLPAAQIDSEIRQLIRRLLITALLLALLAVAAGLVLSSFIARPIQALTDAATRLGKGDFSTSIPVGGTAEVAALANTMEDMRRNLVELTGTLRRREGEARAPVQPGSGRRPRELPSPEMTASRLARVDVSQVSQSSGGRRRARETLSDNPAAFQAGPGRCRNAAGNTTRVSRDSEACCRHAHPPAGRAHRPSIGFAIPA
jgi:HAMP domain-containing protein